MSNQINNAQPSFCRRRAVWAKGAEDGRRTSIEAVQERTNPLPTPKEIGESNGEEKAPEKVLKKYECPHCGKEYRRGMYFHQLHCKG